MPAGIVEQPGDHTIAVAPVLAGEFDDVVGQLLFIWFATWNLALSGAVLTKDTAGAALCDAKRLPDMVNARPAA
jgi:hypothetical protein